MAKPFYSLEEVCARLGRSEEDIRGLVREGALREFRDAGKIFFKAEDIDKLAGNQGSGSGEITLEPAEDELPTLSDVKGGTSVLGLEPLGEEPEPAGKQGTAVPSVFDEDELEIEADPMADTQVTTGIDQVSLEGTGGGSGLLDLTREADDTSLGAELLDEIYPGEEEAPAPPPRRAAAAAVADEEESEEAAEEEEEVEEVAEIAAPVYSAAGDSTEGMFTGMLAGTVLLLVVAGSVVAGTLQGYTPSYGRLFAENFWWFVAGATLLPIVALLIGWVIGRSGGAPRRAR